MIYNRDYRLIMREGKRLLKGNEPQIDRHPNDCKVLARIGIILGGFIVLLLCLHGCAYGAEINLDIIADIESSHNPNAVNGGYIGEYQIGQSVIDDLNKHGAGGITLEDMYNPLLSHDAADIYLNRIIPDYLYKYGLPDTINNRLIAWNWGIGHLCKWFNNGSHWNQLPRETRAYIKKYYQEVNQ